MVTQGKIRSTYKRLKVAKVAYVQSATEAEVAKSTYEIQTTTAIQAGLVVGKNATERETSARENLNDLWLTRNETKEKSLRKKLAFEIAQINVDEIRALLRIDELAADVKPSIHGKEEL